MHHQRDIVMKLVFSPDGKYTTSVAIRCSICVWDADSCAPVGGRLWFWDHGWLSCKRMERYVSNDLIMTRDGWKVAFEGEIAT